MLLWSCLFIVMLSAILTQVDKSYEVLFIPSNFILALLAQLIIQIACDKIHFGNVLKSNYVLSLLVSHLYSSLGVPGISIASYRY